MATEGPVSRRKRQRHPKRPARSQHPPDLGRIDWEAIEGARIDRRLAKFQSPSLAILLAAAADSPGGGHRLPSLTVLWVRCLAYPPSGTVTAQPSDLPRLLSAARNAAPQLRILEDCWMPDPRLRVRFPIAGQRFRIHAGSLTNPSLTLRSVMATAEAIDEFVLGSHGFRLTDLVEVALRYSDHQLEALCEAWPA